MGNPLRILLACCTCQCWCPYFNFLHNFVRTCRLCIEVGQGAKNTVKKILFFLFMCCCGFGLIQCFFCLVGVIHMWKGPCQTFQSEGDILKAYHQIVWEENCESENTVKNALKKVF